VTAIQYSYSAVLHTTQERCWTVWCRVVAPLHLEELLLLRGQSLSNWWLDSFVRLANDLRKVLDSLVRLVSFLDRLEGPRVFRGEGRDSQPRSPMLVGNEWITAGLCELGALLSLLRVYTSVVHN
jgi:hypothetical protein